MADGASSDVGAQSMVQHLEALLGQLEGAQGGEDPEARALMDQLRQQLGKSAATPSQPGPGNPGGSQPESLETEEAVAKHLDSLEAQLDHLQQTIRNAPDNAKQLAGEMWLSKDGKAGEGAGGK